MRTVHRDLTSHARTTHDLKQDREKLYRSAILELDRSKLPQRIEAAQAAILARSRRLADSPVGDCREQDAITRALHILLLLRKIEP